MTDTTAMRGPKKLIAQLIDRTAGRVPYSTANIEGGRVYRRSYPWRMEVNGEMVRYTSKARLKPETIAQIDNMAASFQRQIRETMDRASIDSTAFTVKWHIGAVLYMSVRTERRVFED